VRSSDATQMREAPARTIRHILVMTYGHVADVLAAGPSLKALRETYPQATINVLAVEYVRDLLEACPYVDNVVILPDFKYKGTPWFRAEQTLGLVRAAPRLLWRYDMVLVLHARSNFLARLAFLTAAPVRAGYQDGGPVWLFTHHAQPYNNIIPFRDENRRVLQAINVPVRDSRMEIWTSPHDDAAVAAMLEEAGVSADDTLVGLHPGTHWSCQQWYPERWAQVGNGLRTRYGAKIIITGTADEAPLAEEIAAGMGERPIVLTGRTTVPQFASLIRRLQLLVCVNSAASQIALATRTPMLNLIGYENPTWTAAARGEAMTVIQGFKPGEARTSWCPWGVWGKLSECHREAACLGRGGLQTIGPEAVFAAAERHLANKAPARSQAGYSPA
jgi:heptosyltransferase-2